MGKILMDVSIGWCSTPLSVEGSMIVIYLAGQLFWSHSPRQFLRSFALPWHLLFLFLVLNCASLSHEDVLEPKENEYGLFVHEHSSEHRPGQLLRNAFFLQNLFCLCADSFASNSQVTSFLLNTNGSALSSHSSWGGSTSGGNLGLSSTTVLSFSSNSPITIVSGTENHSNRPWIVFPLVSIK